MSGLKETCLRPYGVRAESNCDKLIPASVFRRGNGDEGFRVCQAVTVARAVRELGRNRDAKVLAGGIDLLGELREGIIAPRRVVNIKGIKEPSGIRLSEKEGLRLGALTTLKEIESYPVIRQRYTALAQAAHSVGTPQIRNIGPSVEICAKDRGVGITRTNTSVVSRRVVLYALLATVKTNTTLSRGEVLATQFTPPIALFPSSPLKHPSLSSHPGVKGLCTLRFPPFAIKALELRNNPQTGRNCHQNSCSHPFTQTQSTYLKFKERDSHDFAVVGVAVAMGLNGKVCEDVCIVLSGAELIPWRSLEGEEVLKGKAITPGLAEGSWGSGSSQSSALAQNEYKILLTQAIVMELKSCYLKSALSTSDQKPSQSTERTIHPFPVGSGLTMVNPLV